MFKQELNMIYRPHGRVLNPKWLVLVKNGIFFHIWLLWET